jgi:hypothetical protein
MVRPLLTTARRLFALALVVSVALAAALSGRSYLWCVPMQRVMATACLEDEHPDEDAHAPTMRAPCCEMRALGELPRADTRPELPHVAPAVMTLASVLPIGVEAHRFPSAQLTSAPRTIARHGPIRAGPCSSAARCIALQVFRC